MNIDLIGIVAISKNGCIGRNGHLPWSLPNDLKLFRKITMGHPVLMGRKTHEAIGRLLPCRQNIVLTRDKNYKALDGAIVIHDIDELYKMWYNLHSNRVFVIGGASIYSQLFNRINEWYVSRVHYEVEGDTYFDYDWDSCCEKQELIYADEDFTTTHYLRAGVVFGNELFTHSNDFFAECVFKYNKTKKDIESEFFSHFGERVYIEKSLETPTHTICLRMWDSGNIIFYAIPDESNVGRNAHPDLSRYYFDIVNPIEVMGYNPHECERAFNKIWQYIYNNFSFVHENGVEPLPMCKDIAISVYDKMLNTVSLPSEDLEDDGNVYLKRLEPYIDYFERRNFCDYMYDTDYMKVDGEYESIHDESLICEERVDNLIYAITHVCEAYLRHQPESVRKKLSLDKHYRSESYVRKLSKSKSNILSEYRDIVEAVYKLLTFRTNACFTDSDFGYKFVDENYIIEKCIINIQINHKEQIEQYYNISVGCDEQSDNIEIGSED